MILPSNTFGMHFIPPLLTHTHDSDGHVKVTSREAPYTPSMGRESTLGCLQSVGAVDLKFDKSCHLYHY